MEGYDWGFARYNYNILQLLWHHGDIITNLDMMGFFFGGYDGDNYLMKTTVYFTVSLGEGIHPNLSPTVRCFFGSKVTLMRKPEA